MIKTIYQTTSIELDEAHAFVDGLQKALDNKWLGIKAVYELMFEDGYRGIVNEAVQKYLGHDKYRPGPDDKNEYVLLNRIMNTGTNNEFCEQIYANLDDDVTAFLKSYDAYHALFTEMKYCELYFYGDKGVLNLTKWLATEQIEILLPRVIETLKGSYELTALDLRDNNLTYTNDNLGLTYTIKFEYENLIKLF